MLHRVSMVVQLNINVNVKHGASEVLLRSMNITASLSLLAMAGVRHGEQLGKFIAQGSSESIPTVRISLPPSSAAHDYSSYLSSFPCRMASSHRY